MAKLHYERVSTVEHTTLGEANIGDVIIWADALYIVTDNYLDDNNAYRGIMNILSAYFGILEYIDEGVSVDILEDAEITIKY